MKLIDQEGTDLGLDGTEFTLKASAKAFHILSSSLYSNKILAVVRELSCNAWDSHIDAEKTNTRFDVTLPTRNNNVFSIRDYGLGLSPESMKHVYTTYFESTKTDSNDKTGALGLGSKSPFCVVKEFTVESFFEGMHYVYLAYIGPNGMPTLSKISDAPTSETNGVKISVEKRWSWSEISEFKSAAESVYRWFPLTPTVYGEPVQINKPEVIEQLSENISIIKGSSYGKTLTIQQGTVAYEVRYNTLESAGVVSMPQLNLLIEVPIGSIDVTAGREDVSFVQTTIDTLEAVGKEVNDIISQKCIAHLSKSAGKNVWKINIIKSELEDIYPHTVVRPATSQYCEINNINPRELKSTSFPHTYPVLDIKTYIAHAPISAKSVQHYTSDWDASSAPSIEFTPGNTIVFINDQNKGVATRLRKIRQNHSNKIIVIDFYDRKNYDSALISSLLETLKQPCDEYLVYASDEYLVYASDVKVEKSPRSFSSDSKTTPLTVTTIDDTRTSKAEYDAEKMKDAYFVDMDNISSSMYGKWYKPAEVASLIDTIERLTKKRLRVYGVNKTQRRLFKKNDIKLRPIDTIVEDCFKDYKFDNVLEQYKCLVIKTPFSVPRPEYVSEFLRLCKVPHIVDYVNSLPEDEYKVNKKISALSEIAELDPNSARFECIRNRDKMRTSELKLSLFNEVNTKCPMLQYVDTWSTRSETYPMHLANYINACYGV